MHILGCGAALPLPGRNPTAQLVNVHEKQFLFDCGEGTQIALRHGRIRMMRIDHIAISHMHGDHYFGLFGLISTFNLLGRTRDLHLYGPPALQGLLAAQEAAGETVRGFPIIFHPTSTEAPEVLFEDGSVRLESFPVRHRIPTTGFLLREQPREPGVKRAEVRKWDLQPSEVLALKRGEDVHREDGTQILFADACHPRPRFKELCFCGRHPILEAGRRMGEGGGLALPRSHLFGCHEGAGRKDLPHHGAAGWAAGIGGRGGAVGDRTCFCSIRGARGFTQRGPGCVSGNRSSC